MFDDRNRGSRRGRTGLVALGMVVLVVTTGCLGFLGGGDGGTPTANGSPPASSPTATATATATPTATPVPGELPPGVGERGSVDVGRLLAAHEDSLSGTSFVTRIRSNRSVETGDGVTSSINSKTIYVGSDGSVRINFTQTVAGRVIASDRVWTNGSVAVNRTSVRGQVSYGRLDAESLQRRANGTQVLSQYLRIGTLTVESVDQDAGRLVLTANGTAEDTEGLAPGTTVREYSARVVVDTSGRIYEANVTASFTTADGTDATLDVEYRLSGVGETTVQRPEWVSTALDETDSETSS